MANRPSSLPVDWSHDAAQCVAERQRQARWSKGIDGGGPNSRAGVKRLLLAHRDRRARQRVRPDHENGEAKGEVESREGNGCAWRAQLEPAFNSPSCCQHCPSRHRWPLRERATMGRIGTTLLLFWCLGCRCVVALMPNPAASAGTATPATTPKPTSPMFEITVPSSGTQSAYRLKKKIDPIGSPLATAC